MNENKIKGIIISGKFGEIIARQKSYSEIEIGELLIADNKNLNENNHDLKNKKQSKTIFQVYDLIYGSQISSQNLELISGLKLEENSELYFMDEKLRSYNLAILKNLLVIDDNKIKLAKNLPDFFSELREIKKEDLAFLTMPENSLFLGNLRSGSKVLDVPIYLKGDDVLSHHILIPATTGRGKSNLTYVMLWDLLDKDYAGILVLDPHDEYYGRNKLGLKDHHSKKLVYYTPSNVPAGQRTLKINLKQLLPYHFDGSLDLTTAQKEAINVYYREYNENWIEALLLEKETKSEINESTLAVLKRKFSQLLDIDFDSIKIYPKGIFDLNLGKTTIIDICNELEKRKIVIIDTSSFSGNIEILIGSLITTEIFNRYKNYKSDGSLKDKPIINIILEEAPRVLGKEVLEKGSNIFSTIAREGRKFKIGLTAITQLPSLIPREILANMNTKIILGIEMQQERQAIIESASQDLSKDARAIASLDKGEAIITSNFTKFAIPVKIPLFEEFAKKTEKQELDFYGIGFTSKI
ncbi:MAG: ATP-binding protein [Candidatus Woesearchaeota archaeon]